MWKFIFALIIALSFNTTIVGQASIFTPFIEELRPNDPFYSEEYCFDNCLAEEITIKQYQGERLQWTSKHLLTHNQEGLIDTVYTYDNGYKELLCCYTYYLNGKVKSWKQPVNNIYEEYEWTDDGRILSITSPYYMKNFYYTNSDIDSLISMRYSDRLSEFVLERKTIVQYTDSGYIKSEYVYLSDENKYKETADYVYNYVFNDQNRICRVYASILGSDTYLERYYIYDSDIITMVLCNEQGQPSQKYINIYKDGYLSELALFHYMANGSWSRMSTSMYSYSFPESTKISALDLSRISISGRNGEIYIKSDGNKYFYNIYDLRGNLIACGKSMGDETNIPVGIGIYIVKVNDMLIKVIIK